MADRTISAALVGCTGLVGSNILSTLVSLPTFSPVHAIARRGLSTELTKSPSLSPHISIDTDAWPDLLASVSPMPSIMFSALGTTRGQAGSVDAQRKVDFDLNLAIAKAAKDAGVNTYVLVSTSGANASSMIPYARMKGELDDSVSKLGFKHTVVLRPGLLVGTRENSRPTEAALHKIANLMGGVRDGLKDFWAQDAEVVARAAVAAAQECTDGRRKDGVWIVDQAEIVRLGRKEWQASQ